MKQPLAVRLLALALALCPLAVKAQSIYWTGTTGAWNVPANWVGGVVPSSGDAFINSGTAQLGPGVSGTAGRWLEVGNAASQTGTLNISGGSMTAGTSYIGDSGGAVGIVSMTSGTWTNNSTYVGYNGTGSVSISGGLFTSSDASLGSFQGSSGSIMVSGGTWNQSSWMRIGIAGTGSLLINGGYVTTNFYADIGNGSASGSGTATVSSGTWSVNGPVNVGTSGTGTLRVDGGVLQAANINGGNNGTFSFNGGILRARSGATNFVTGFASGVTINAGRAFIDSNGFAIGIPSAFTGTGGLTKVGSGTLTLTGSNVYSGSTMIQQGTLAVNSGGSINHGSAWLNVGTGVGQTGTLAIGPGGSVTDERARVGVSGTGAVTVSGSGATWISTDQIYIGTQSTGTLGITAGGSVTVADTLYVGNNFGVQGTVTVSGTGSSLSVGGAIVGLLGTGVMNLTDGGVLTAGGGAGTLQLAGLDGSSGTLNIGTGGLSGILNAAAVTTASAIGNTGVVNFNHTDNITFASRITGKTSVNKLASGTTTFTGSNIYTGTTTISAGALQLGNGGTTGSITGNVTNNSSLIFNRSDALGYNGVISGTGVVTQLGSGTTTLGGSNTYTGGTIVQTGMLTRSVAGGFVNNTPYTVNGGVLDLNNLDLTASSFSGSGGVVSLGSGTLTVDQSTATSYAGSISGTGGLTKLGSGTLTLTGSNTYGGGTTIKNGTLAVNGAGVVSHASAPLIVGDSSGDNGSLRIGGGLVSNSIGYVGSFAGTRGDVTVTSGTWLNASQLNIGGSGTGSFRLEGGLVSGSTTVLGTSTSGFGTAVVTGGTWSTATALSIGYTGSGNLLITGGLVTGASGRIAEFAQGRGSVTVSGGTWASTGAVNVGDRGTGYLLINGGVVSGSTAVVGSATTGVGTATVTSGTWLNSSLLSVGTVGTGSLQIGGGYVSAAAVTIGSNTAGNGAAVITGGTLASAGNLAVNGSGRLLVDGGYISNVNGSIGSGTTGRGSATVTSGTWSGTGLTIAGDLLVNGGYLSTSTGHLAFSAGQDGTATVSSGTWAVGNFIGVGYRGTGDLLVTGGLVSASNIQLGSEVTGSGTVRLNGGVIATGQVLENLGSGSFVFNGGTLRATASQVNYMAGFEDGDVTIASGGAIIDSNGFTVGISASLSGAGGLTKLGAGRLNLTGSNSYSGATTVTSGTLAVNGINSGTGAMSVQSGAALSGTGSIAGRVTIDNGAILAPGNPDGIGGASPGTLTVGSMILNASSDLQFELGTVSDLVVVMTDLTLDGVLNVTSTSGFGAGSYTLFQYGGTLTNEGLTLGTMPSSAFLYAIDLSQAGYVRLNVATPNLYWDGPNTTPDGLIMGGSGTWNNSLTNWTTASGSSNFAWMPSGTANFTGTAGTVTVAETINVNNMVFTSSGYLLSGPGSLANSGSTLTISTGSSVAARIDTPITGTGGLAKTDSGTLALGGANTYTGTTAVIGGSLQIVGSGNVGPGSILLNNGWLEYARTGTITLAQQIFGDNQGQVRNSGGALLIISGTNSGFTGGIWARSGTTRLTNSQAAGNGAGQNVVVVSQNGVLDLVDGVNLGTRLDLQTSSGAINVSSGTASQTAGLTEANSISRNLNKTGAGTFVLAGTASYTGTSNVQAGTLRAGSATGFAQNTAYAVSSGATLDLNGFDLTATSLTGTGSVLLGTGTLLLAPTGSTAFAGGISGAGSLVKIGAGTFTLTGSSNYTGGTTVRSGTLMVGNGGAITGTNYIIVGSATGENATFLLDGGLVRSGSSVLANSLGSSGAFTVNSGTFDNTGGLVIGSVGAGTLNVIGGVVSSTNATAVIGSGSFSSGVATVSGGTWNSGGAIVGQSGTGVLNINGGVVEGGSYRLGSEAGSDGTLTVTGGRSTGGDVIIGFSGTGRMALSGGSIAGFRSYMGFNAGSHGSALVSGGTWSLGSLFYLGNRGEAELEIRGGLVENSSAGIGIFAGSRGSATVSGGTWNAGSSLSVGVDGAGTLDVSGGLVQSTGTLAIGNTGTGVMTVTGGTVSALSMFLASGTTGVGTINVGTGSSVGVIDTALISSGSGSGTVNFNHTGTVNFTPGMAGSLVVNKLGAGTTVLTGSSSYTGATTINGGQLTVNGMLGNTEVTVSNGAALAGSGTIAGQVTVADGGILAPGNSPGTLTVGSLLLNSTSALNFELGTASDLVVVMSDLTLDGVLNVTSLSGFGVGSYTLFQYAPGMLTNNGLTFGMTPSGFLYSLDLSTDGLVRLVVGPPDLYWDGTNTTPDGTVGGGSGTWNNSGTNTNWTNADGTTNFPWVGLGTANFTGTAGIVNVADTINVADIVFETDGYVLTGTGALAISGSTLAIATGQNVTTEIGTTITGTGGLVKTGTGGRLILTGSNEYTGGTTIATGTLQLGNGGTTGSIVGDVLNNGTLVFNRSDEIIFGNIISGSGNVLVNQTGTLALTGSNSYAGGTSLVNGTLLVGDDNALGTGGLTLGDGTTFGVVAGGDILLANNMTIGGDVRFSVDGSSILEIEGTVSLGSFTRTFTFTEDSSQVCFMGEISGSAGLTLLMSGTGMTGEVLMCGPDSNTYSGLTTVGDGVFLDLMKETGATAIAGDLRINQGGIVEIFDTSEQINPASTVTVNGTLGIMGISGTTTQTIGSLFGVGQIENLGDRAVLTVSAGSYQGSITDSGADALTLVKSSAGTLELSGNNSYNGGTVINQGTLRTASQHALGNAATNAVNVSLNAGTLNPVGRLTIDTLDWAGGTIASALGTTTGLLEATGNLSLTGVGQFEFTAGAGFTPNNPYAILTTANLGSFTIADFVGNALAGLAAVFKIEGDTLYVSFNGETTGPVIQNSGPYFTPADADFVVNGRVTTGTPNDNNTVRSLIFGNGSSLQVFNNLTVTSGNFTVASGSSTVTGGNVIAPGTFTKFGSGVLNFLSNVSVGGPANVTAGSLMVNGIFTTGGGLTVFQNALLGGAGIINGDVVNNGIVAPGNSPGTLTINGNFVNNNTLEIEIASADIFDRLIVSGNAALGGTLQVIPFGGNRLEYGQQFAFLQAGSISGGFDQILMPNPDEFRGRFLVNGGIGTLVVAPTSYTLVAETTNQKNVAAALDSYIPEQDNDRETVSIALDLQSAAQYPAAFDQIAPTYYESLGNITISQAFVQSQQLNQRLSAVRLGAQGFQAIGIESPLKYDNDGKSVLESKDVKKNVEVEMATNWNIWAMGNGLFARVTNVGQVPGYSFNSGGFLVGADYRWSENFSTGVYTGYQYTWADAGESGNTQINSALFGGYATYQNGGFYADGILGGGYNDYRVRRGINFSTIDRTARSQPNGGLLNASLNLGYDWEIGKFTLGPIAGVQYAYAGIAPFSETGADSLDLRVAQQNINSMRTTFGGRIAYTWNVTDKIVIIPEVRMLWQHEFLNNPRNISSSLDGGAGPTFGYETTAPARDSVFAGAGVSAQFGEHWNAFFYYNVDFGRQDYLGNSISGGLNWKF